jgi:hypothetical protein
MLGAIPPLPQYAFMVWCSVKTHKDTLPYLTLIGRMRREGREDWINGDNNLNFSTILLR